MSETDEALIIREFAAAEVASALSRLVGTGKLEGADALARLAGFDAWRAAATVDLAFSGVRHSVGQCGCPPV